MPAGLAMTTSTADARDDALLAALDSAAGAHLALATRMLGQREDAREALQEAWLRAWRGRRGLREGAAIHGWVRQIVVRECLRRLRWRAARAWLLSVAEPPEVPDAQDSPEATAVSAERAAAVRRAAQQLSPRQRLVWGLRVDEQWTVAEIAAATELRPDTVRTHLARALRKITDALETDHGPL